MYHIFKNLLQLAHHLKLKKSPPPQKIMIPLNFHIKKIVSMKKIHMNILKYRN